MINRREFLKLSAAGGLYLFSDLRWALPQAGLSRRGASQRVVILGAGLAGLSAAWELRQAGHDVTILEAQLHPGGRVHTIREGLSDDLYAEAGAARIPNTHNVTQEWVKYFNLELEPFYPATLAQVALLKGKRVKLPADKPVDIALVPLDLTPAERKAGLAKLAEQHYGDVSKQIGEQVRDDRPPELARLADLSMADFLRQRGASEDAIHYIVLGFEDDAALDFMAGEVNLNAEPIRKIKGGNDQLPRAFAAKLSDAIRYGCAVEHIERRPEGVTIACRHAGTRDQFEADAVICTIPYSVLRHIPVNPPWSAEKRKVIEKLNYGPVVRATFQVRRRYWEDEGLNGFGSSDKKFLVWHPNHGKPGKRGLLQSYNFETYAHELDQLNEADRTDRMISDLNEVHPGLHAQLETVVSKSWFHDPWQQGAYTVYPPGQLEWHPVICRPEGRVWFAGEHASAWPGWMQGALTSGIKAAHDVNAALAGNSPA